MNRCKRTAKLYRIGQAMNQDAYRQLATASTLNPISRARLSAAIRNAAQTLIYLGQSSGKMIRTMARQWGVAESRHDTRRREAKENLARIRRQVYR